VFQTIWVSAGFCEVYCGVVWRSEREAEFAIDRKEFAYWRSEIAMVSFWTRENEVVV
jgi:hypothetical protein